MGKRGKQKAKVQSVASILPTEPFNNAFGALGALRKELTAESGVSDTAEPEKNEAPPPEPKPWKGKLVVRRQRKGHGGKTVTVLEGLTADGAQLEALAKTLASRLGCGARVVAEDVVLSGDLGDRLEAWLRAEGARNVVRGS